MQSLEVDAFVRDHLLADINDNHTMAVRWLSIERSPELLSLQNEVVSAISDKEACITETGNVYSPHFTLWVQDKNQQPAVVPETAYEQIHSILAQMPRSFLCKVIMGTCGPIGQMNERL